MKKMQSIGTAGAVVLVLLTLAAAMPLAQAKTKQVDLDVALGTPVMLAGEKQTAYLRVALTGFAIEDESERTPVNVAIVLDRSGSMGGEKIARAKDAAIMAIGRLRGDDIVSVVAYNHAVQVVVPATRVSDKDAIYRAIQSMQAGGNTALFAGVSKGVAEVRKFLDKERVSRVILLSDGLANVGPASPEELGALGASLLEDGIAVTTIGLGLDYNEDLMAQLATKSDGNHMFAENAVDLAKAFDYEFGQATSVVAQNVLVRIECAPGVRPIRVIGREAEIAGQTVSLQMNQLYGEQMKYAILEVETPARTAGEAAEVARVEVRYRNAQTNEDERARSAATARFTDSAGDVDRHTNKPVMVTALRQVANEQSKLAVKLRDEGRIEDARLVGADNNMRLNAWSDKYDSQVLREDALRQQRAVQEMADDEAWRRGRKQLKGEQTDITNQSIFNLNSLRSR